MNLLINEQITLALFDASRLLREAFEHTYRDMKLSWPQIRIMGRLYAQEDITQSEVGTQLEMDPMTISRQIDRLVDLGFVERRTEARDRRLRKLYLTPQARELREEIMNRGQNVLKQALKGFDEDQQTAILSKLMTIADNLSEPGPYSAPNAARLQYGDKKPA
ncbi:MarR family winged helix-turn-helix transcriptional regulator [Fulvimarina sp. MAC8]|uniref:MarR family winged helix-turn-helix transcriptional regulator n=1 Tax=Fulvimarina sp. MAC8 TaxID=3162874 RepID=UPI0032EF0FFE